MKYRKVMIFLLLFLMLFLSSCQPQNIPEETEKINDQNFEELDTVYQHNLFPDDKLYNNNEAIEITVNGELVPTTFYQIRHTNYGAYIPELIKVIEFEDGTEFKFNVGESITIIPIDLSNENISDFESAKKSSQKIAEDYGAIAPFIEMDVLKVYNEYLGSKVYNDIGKREDYFLFRYNQQENAMIRLNYSIKDEEKVLPLFLETIKNIKYVPIQ